jgi:hypothetical protein
VGDVADLAWLGCWQVLLRLEALFTREEVPAGVVLWRRNDPSTWACILESGERAGAVCSALPSRS